MSSARAGFAAFQSLRATIRKFLDEQRFRRPLLSNLMKFLSVSLFHGTQAENSKSLHQAHSNGCNATKSSLQNFLAQTLSKVISHKKSSPSLTVAVLECRWAGIPFQVAAGVTITVLALVGWSTVGRRVVDGAAIGHLVVRVRLHVAGSLASPRASVAIVQHGGQLGASLVLVGHILDVRRTVLLVAGAGVALVSRLPGHLVLLLQSPPGVRKPGGHLSQGHLRDDRQHDLLALRRVRVLAVLVQPGLQCVRRLSRRVLPPIYGRLIVAVRRAVRRAVERGLVIGVQVALVAGSVGHLVYDRVVRFGLFGGRRWRTNKKNEN